MQSHFLISSWPLKVLREFSELILYFLPQVTRIWKHYRELQPVIVLEVSDMFFQLWQWSAGVSTPTSFRSGLTWNCKYCFRSNRCLRVLVLQILWVSQLEMKIPVRFVWKNIHVVSWTLCPLTIFRMTYLNLLTTADSNIKFVVRVFLKMFLFGGNHTKCIFQFILFFYQDSFMHLWKKWFIFLVRETNFIRARHVWNNFNSCKRTSEILGSRRQNSFIIFFIMTQKKGTYQKVAWSWAVLQHWAGVSKEFIREKMQHS